MLTLEMETYKMKTIPILNNSTSVDVEYTEIQHYPFGGGKCCYPIGRASGLTTSGWPAINPGMVPSVRQVKVRIAELGLRTDEVAANVGVHPRLFGAIVNQQNEPPKDFVRRVNRYLDQREAQQRKEERARFRGPWREDWEL